MHYSKLTILKLKGLNNMEKMNEGVLSSKLESVYKLAKNMENDITLIDGCIVLEKRMKALDEYRTTVSSFMSKYEEIAEQLELYSDTRKLLDFIVEWAVYDPHIILGLAEKLSLTITWSHIVDCIPKTRR
ncbi:MAG TPA: hypothetical protein VFF25_02875 [Clostridia bacterium]|nr:hypothetical protein [Clostridia bacterium]